jgi:O-antigen/teichoic acid export membrane protein
MNAVARSALARAASFVPTAAATLLTSRLVIDHYGIATFDSYALILSLINLIPLNNLGVGAAVTAAYAHEDVDQDHAGRTVLTAARVLALSSLATAAVSLLLGALGLWPTLLGEASGPNRWCTVAMVVYAMTFLPGLGQSILLGAHRNHVTIVVQTFFNPLIAILCAVVVLLSLSGNVVMVLPCLALIVIHGITSGFASRVTTFSWWSVLRSLPRRRRYPGASIRALSGPVLIITLSTPIALQSDRIVLSHVSTSQAVAEYSIAFQIFAPALVLIAAAAQPLWPMYVTAHSQGRRGPDVVRTLGVFGGVGALIGAVLALLANPVAAVIAGSHVHVSPLLALSGGLAVLTAALSYPVAMSLMDPVGVRFVVWCTVVALPLNIGVSIVLGKHLGAPGPLLGSSVVGILVQALPGFVYSRDLHSAGRHRRRPHGANPSPLAVAAEMPTPPVVLEQMAE